MIDAIEKGFREAGFGHRVVGVEVVENLNETFAMLLERGLLSESLYKEYADSLRFEPPPRVPAVRSLVVAATPSPPVKVRFHLADGPLEAVIPPTYISSASRARCLRLLEEVLGPAGFLGGPGAGAGEVARRPDRIGRVRAQQHRLRAERSAASPDWTRSPPMPILSPRESRGPGSRPSWWGGANRRPVTGALPGAWAVVEPAMPVTMPVPPAASPSPRRGW